MNSRRTNKPSGGSPGKSRDVDHGRIVSVPDQTQCLDAVQLNTLELDFRRWVAQAPRRDAHLSRRRILLIFLLIRYTGAKLNEVLALNPLTDFTGTAEAPAVFFRDTLREAVGTAKTGAINDAGRVGTQDPAGTDEMFGAREVHISEALAREIREISAEPALKGAADAPFAIDPGFVRRKFYERAQACGFSKRLGGPEMIRKARAVELMQANMPLPAVQMLLGHSTPNLTSAYVSFSKEEMHKVMRFFIERESTRKTSARNSFFGKLVSIQRGDIQSRVELTTIGGHAVTTIITNDSLERLGLHEGRLVTAEVKAPWVILCKGECALQSTAENRFSGLVKRIHEGRVSTECVVALSDGTELCAIVTTQSYLGLNLAAGDAVGAFFSSFAVVLHVD